MSDESVIERLTKQLGLIAHPTGSGMFKEVWKGDRQVTFVGNSQSAPRSTGTSIYFLLKAPNVLNWHKHRSDCAMFWHAGNKANFHVVNEDGSHTCSVLGDVVTNGDCVAHVNIPHGSWYSTEIAGGTGFCLYSCVVMPGFEYEDWTEGKKDELVKLFPQHEELISRLA